MKANMTSRERILTAIRREEPDRVPFCELGVDRSLAERLMGWPATQTAAGGSLTRNPYTVKEKQSPGLLSGVQDVFKSIENPGYRPLPE